LRLVKGDFSVCPKRKPNSASRAAARVVRALWGDGKGQFRTRGQYASATVRGTRWLTADRCDGTFTRVARQQDRGARLPEQQDRARACRPDLPRPAVATGPSYHSLSFGRRNAVVPASRGRSGGSTWPLFVRAKRESRALRHADVLGLAND